MTTSYTRGRYLFGQGLLFLLIALACGGRLAAQGAVQPPVVTGGTAGAIEGNPYVFFISATNSPTSFGASNLPPGLVVNTLTGTIGGTCTDSGTFTVELSATNSGGTGTATLILTVDPTAPLFNSSLAEATGQVGQPFTYQITASNTPASFGASRLPAGLSVNGSTGVISGTPTASGTFNVDLSATNIAGTGNGLLTIAVTPASQVTAPNFEVLESFGVLGAEPMTPVIQGSDGSIYGTTSGTGSDFAATIFQVTPAGAFTNLFTFDGNGDGGDPNAGFFQGNDGNFYGSASGTVFKITPTGVFTVLHTFTGGADGSASICGPTQGNDGNFYGAASSERYGTYGSVYQVTPAGYFTTLHTFTANEANAVAGLIQGSDGNLYGVTSATLNGSYGTVFEMTLAGIITTLHNFTGGADGGNPSAGLIQGSDGNFYGTTAGGSAGSKHGTVFKITPAGALTTLHVFAGGADGSAPSAALIQGNNGNFYGTTSGGGDENQDGTIFEITPTGVLTTLYQFSGADGSSPHASLTQGSDGNLYGTTKLGGQYKLGVVFRLTLPSSPVVTLAATVPQAVVGGGGAGVFTLSLPAPQSADVDVSYTIKGAAINGKDYQLIKSSKKIKAGKTSKNINIVPQGDLGGASKKSVSLILQPGPGYQVGTTGKVKVEILSAGQ